MPAGIFGKLDTVIIRITDLEKSRKWYEEKLELKPAFTSEKEHLVVYDTGGATSLTIWQLKPGEKLPRRELAGCFPIFYSPNADASHRQLRERGVEVSSIEEGDGSRYFSFFDPDGNRLEVCQY